MQPLHKHFAAFISYRIISTQGRACYASPIGFRSHYGSIKLSSESSHESIILNTHSPFSLAIPVSLGSPVSGCVTVRMIIPCIYIYIYIYIYITLGDSRTNGTISVFWETVFLMAQL